MIRLVMCCPIASYVLLSQQLLHVQQLINLKILGVLLSWCVHVYMTIIGYVAYRGSVIITTELYRFVASYYVKLSLHFKQLMGYEFLFFKKM